MKWELFKKIIFKYQRFIKVTISLLLMAALIRVFVLKFSELQEVDWAPVLDSLDLLPVLLLLMLLNWSLEALKWQAITLDNSFLEAVRVVLVGLLLKQFIPFGLGELSGRMLADRRTAKKEVAGAFMLVGFIQFAVTVLLGCFGVGWLLSYTTYDLGQVTVWGLGIALGGILMIILLKNQIQQAYDRWFDALGVISSAKLSRVTVLSLVRYLVFFLQSVVIFGAFIPEAGVWMLSAGISFVFLAKTIVPNVGFAGDIGVRGFSAVLFFGYFGIGAMPVILAGLCVWVINIFLPSFVALFFIRKV